MRFFLIAAAAVALGVAAGCGGGGSSPTSTPSGSAQAPATTTAAPGGTGAVPLPSRPGQIAAGLYETATFRPALVFQLPAGFKLQRPEYEDWLSLANDIGSISILDVDSAQVIDPKASESPTTADLRAAPADLLAWLTQHPSLEVSAPTAVTVAGFPAKQLDVRAKPGASDPALFYTHEVLLSQPNGSVARTIVFNAGGHQVAITMLAFAKNLEAFAATADQLVSSLRLSTSTPATATPIGGGACGTVQTFPSVGRNHVTVAPPASTYNSFPPTSGPHYPSPAPWAVYTKPFPQFVLIHNLEHGGIVVQYGKDIPADAVSAIAAWVEADPDGMLLAPLPELGNKIALTAWTHLLDCTQFDAKAFSSFRDAYRYKGPELLSADTYKPSTAA